MSSVANPYASPQAADLTAGTGDAPIQPKIFSFSGRIGRLRLLAYSMISSFTFVVIGGLLAAVLVPVNPAAGWLIYIAATLLSMVYGVALYVRRLNDLGQSGLWVLLMFVPLLNFALIIYALFFRGDAGANAYGPPPTPNAGGTVVALILAIFLGVALMGMVAAVAIPAYQDYVERAQQMQAR